MLNNRWKAKTKNQMAEGWHSTLGCLDTYLVDGGKAMALGALSYGAKKALEAATHKQRQ